jgi:hypothetical protein
MKSKIRQLDEEEIIRNYPITGKLNGWYFRSSETSPHTYTVEGTDKWGRKVSRIGENPDDLLKRCIEDAKQISEQIKTEPASG